MTNAHVVSRSPSSIEIGFIGRDFADAYKVYIDANPDRATIAIDNSLPSAANRPMNRQGRPLSGGSITKDVRDMVRRSGKAMKVPRHKKCPTGNPENIDSELVVHYFVFGFHSCANRYECRIRTTLYFHYRFVASAAGKRTDSVYISMDMQRCEICIEYARKMGRQPNLLIWGGMA